MAELICYHTQKTHNCGCGAVIRYGSGEIRYNSAGIGRVRCPACGGYPVVDDNPLLQRFRSISPIDQS